MKDSSVARRYAKALFGAAVHGQQIDPCSQMLEEISRAVQTDRSFAGCLTHPFIPLAEKTGLVRSIFGSLLTPLMERFLQLLIEAHRFNLIIEIADRFQEELDRHQNVEPVSVKVAYPMPEARRKMLQEKLKNWLQADVRMEVRVAPEIIGGLIVRTRDRECDQSLRTELRQLQAVITS
jgi:F-type H+-transporting ATPase subunit delta